MRTEAIHYNVPQLKFQLVQANKSYGVMSRGLGKSSGIGSVFLLNNAMAMPRGTGGIVGATYQQLLVRTLPPVINNWHRMGYKRDVHFIIGKDPFSKENKRWREQWNWEPPYTMPLNSKNAIYWFNGATQVLISQDVTGSANGMSLNYNFGDEAKLLDREQYEQEIAPTLRGDRDKFGHLSCYRSEMFLTDMPTKSDGMWILDKVDQMNHKLIDLIIDYELYLNHLTLTFFKASPHEKLQLHKDMKLIKKRLNILRKKAVYYAEANAMDNIAVLGQEFIDDMKANLTQANFLTSIMNEKYAKIEDGFYGQFEPAKHGTDWFKYEYVSGLLGVDNSNYNETCDQDAGFISTKPLDIALDYGKFNCLVTGQQNSPQEYRLLRGFHRYSPDLVQDVVQDFCDYYKTYPTKKVNYFYDHTAKPRMANQLELYFETVIRVLRRNGWQVNAVYVGQSPSHDLRYKAINSLFSETDKTKLRVRYSRSGLADWEISMGNADTKQGEKGVGKNKDPERDKKANQAHTTHYSEASDTLLFHRVIKGMGVSNAIHIPLSMK